MDKVINETKIQSKIENLIDQAHHDTSQWEVAGVNHDYHKGKLAAYKEVLDLLK